VFAPLLTSIAMLAVLFLIFHFGFRLSPKILSKVLVALIIVFSICALAYMAASIEYVSEDHNGEGRLQRVVLGYELKGELDKQIKVEAEAAIAERDREQDPLQNASSVNGPPGGDPSKGARDADKVAPFKTEDQIREERVDQLVARTGDPTAPYTESSQTIVAYGLFLLWQVIFVSLAACVGILTVASRLVLKRGALIPKAR
jgi:hypothetical protein